MKHGFRTPWTGVKRRSFKQERRAQVAALCYRDVPDGKQVLLITSRDTKRWIVPKGWPIAGLDGPASALQEAWEEAGVRTAHITDTPVGTYGYDKRLRDGDVMPIDTTVYLTCVSELADRYPEVNERSRAWVTPVEASQMVAEPELQAIFRGL